MNSIWLLEEDIFRENLELLQTEIIKQGYGYQTIKYLPFESGKYDNILTTDNCLIFYGSLGLGRMLVRYKKANVNVFCTLENYECTKYYAYFGEYLLNKNYIMLPLKELQRRKDFLFKTFSEDNCLFIRPSSGFKSFTGHIVKLEEYEETIKDLDGYYQVLPHAMIVVAEPQMIKEEYRLVVANSQIISGSRYKSDDFFVPDDVFIYAKKVLEIEYNPDPVWTLDICRTAEGLHVLEIGGFSCAGLYKCDLEPIVKEVSKIALELQDISN
ncbi:MAG: ATP-grasp domain-containing protein [Nanoarchaeota archaeon]